MANIQNELNNIKNALFGQEVRGSIHDGIDAINKEVESTTSRQVDLESTFDQLVINAGNSNAEIVDARVKADGTSYSKLGDRLDSVDSQLEQIVYQVSKFKRLDNEDNDSYRLQRAIDFTSNIKATLQIDESLLLRQTVNLKDNTSLFSNNSNAKIYTDVGSSNDGLILLLGKSVKNIKIIGLTIEGMGYGTTSPEPKGAVEGSGSGIMLANCENIVIDGCTVSKCGGYRGREGVGNIWLSCCKRARITNNTVFLGGNLICVDRWYVFNEGYEDIHNQDIVISNNNLFWCSGRGIALENTNEKGNIVITGNTFSGIGYSAIEGRDWINVSIIGNVIDGNKDLKINAKDYLNSSDENWNWNTYDNIQFGIEAISGVKECVISDNIIKNVKYHGIKLNNIRNSVVSSNSLNICEDCAIYIKNADFNTNTLNISNNTINECPKGIYLTKDADSGILFDGVVIEGNSIKSNEGITIAYLYMGILSNNNLKPITEYNGSFGIKLSKSLCSILNSNIYKNFTTGVRVLSDEYSKISDRFINCSTSIYIDSGKGMLFDCFIHGGTTAINNISTTSSDATKTTFSNINTRKTGHGLKIEVSMELSTTTGNAPSSGIWSIGDIILNSKPKLGTPYGLICTGNSGDGGTGQWKNISIISEN